MSERRLIEGISFLSSRAGDMVGTATKLLDYEGSVRSVPLDQLEEEIEETRELLDEIEEEIEKLRPEE